MNSSSDRPMLVAVVDDTPLNLILMSKLVDRLGQTRAQAFERPAEALSWCIRHEPDLVIVDYMMPDMDGLEFIRRLRSVRNRDDLPTRVRQLRSQVLVFAGSHFQKCHYNSANCSGAAGFSIPNA